MDRRRITGKQWTAEGRREVRFRQRETQVGAPLLEGRLTRTDHQRWEERDETIGDEVRFAAKACPG